MPKNLAALIILDGWGLGADYPGNAIKKAKTPNYNKLIKQYPNTKLKASGLSVGLPEGQMGNSEVGHLNIGAGRVVYQELTRITKATQNGEFFKKQEFLNAIENAKKNNGKLHLMGLLSPGGVHSHSKHLYALLSLAKKQNMKDVYVHCILDGRDVSPSSAKQYLIELEDKMKEIGVGTIASISGRYYTMDRDKRWDRVKKGYEAMVIGNRNIASSSLEVINKSYDEDVTDEFVIPTTIYNNNKPIALVEDGDSVIFYNFRPDRARQITRAFVDDDFDGFVRNKKVDVFFVCMTQYDKTIKNVEIAYKPQKYVNTLGEYVSKLGYKQLRIAETEKYAHVTFFFNGGVEQPNEGEDRLLIPSPKVATYDLKPEMSALEVKNRVIEQINEDKYDLIVLNFANTDMVGHTGSVEAVTKAIETVDTLLGEIIDTIVSKNGKALITADHGNAEEMIDKNGGKVTAHSTNPVPCIIVGEGDVKLKEDGILADIAPTLLNMMGEKLPEEMTGKSIIVK
ncbi:2,3-bisphosphoglycerate-independent phosphoglycerate mutase [Abyssisolibacter fermentans]|uniref:2,3-bisphosphoglycerate-independent phosphoglycerate mutase n=1 Tax=Abyssisolibacter fermentans TaxID=1766203 RepID=UPI000834660A|nr:2,3-bisphosphoglycerate-independent phosphoglycerate mutase [Abyssisolibacter fermentans]